MRGGCCLSYLVKEAGVPPVALLKVLGLTATDPPEQVPEILEGEVPEGFPASQPSGRAGGGFQVSSSAVK